MVMLSEPKRVLFAFGGSQDLLLPSGVLSSLEVMMNE
jgi:hypothetical protein